MNMQFGPHFDPAKDDFTQAFQAAQARAHAERGKVSREVFGAMADMVRGLFTRSQPKKADC